MYNYTHKIENENLLTDDDKDASATEQKCTMFAENASSHVLIPICDYVIGQLDRNDV